MSKMKKSHNRKHVYWTENITLFNLQNNHNLSVFFRDVNCQIKISILFLCDISELNDKVKGSVNKDGASSHTALYSMLFTKGFYQRHKSVCEKVYRITEGK